MTQLSCAPIALSPDWPLIGGLDLGTTSFSAVRIAWDRVTDVAYLTAAYHRAPPTAFDTFALAHWGKALPWAWPAGTDDGKADECRKAGLALVPNPILVSGVDAIHQRAGTGRLKVFAHLPEWIAAFEGAADAHGLLSATVCALLALPHAELPKRAFDPRRIRMPMIA